jgi:hypothetical protein
MKIITIEKIKELESYIKSVLGIEVQIQKIAQEKLNSLPFFFSQTYVMGVTTFFNRTVYLMFADEEITSVDRIRKHIDIAQANLNSMVALVTGNIESYLRTRLIEKKIPFIIAGKQMYLPDLLIDLKEYVGVQKEQPELMPPAAQCLLFYHLLVAPLGNRNMKSIAESMYYMPMTITRAAYFLHNTGLCEIKGTKDKYLSFEENKRELWEKALPLLTSPVKRVNYYTGWIISDELRKTNINALSHYSDLNDEAVEYYAISAGRIQHHEGVNFIKTGKIEANICIEEWKYNPVLLAKDNEYVDPLSLYLCFRDSKNERIEAALEQIIEKQQW